MVANLILCSAYCVVANVVLCPCSAYCVVADLIFCSAYFNVVLCQLDIALHIVLYWHFVVASVSFILYGRTCKDVVWLGLVSYCMILSRGVFQYFPSNDEGMYPVT